MHHRITSSCCVLVVVVAGIVAGCKPTRPNPYVEQFKFIPPSQVAKIRLDGPSSNTAPIATVSASLVGVRKDDPDTGIPSSIEATIRVDNHGPGIITIDPTALELIAGAHDLFPPPQSEPSSTMVVEPSQSRTLIAYFPFPKGQDYESMKLKDVRLNYIVKLDDRSFPQAATFNYLP